VQDVAVAAKKAFFTALFAKEALAVTKVNLELIEMQRDSVKSKVAQGVMSRFDLLVVESEVAAARPRVLEAQNNVLLSTEALLNVIGEPLNRAVELDGQLEFAQLNDTTPDLVNAALRARPEIQALVLQAEMYEETYRIYRANYLPALTANATASRTGGEDNRIWPDHPRDTLQPTLSFGVQLYVPLFDGLRNYGQMKQMQAKKREAQLQLQLLRRGIEMEVTALVSEIKLQEQVYRAHQEAANVAREAHKLTTLRFDSGLSTRLEVTDARMNLINAELGVISALYALNAARADLDRALGR
jgi:outer membrane protein TolC